MADDDDDKHHDVVNFPPQHTSSQVAAQKALATQLVAQMMRNTQEQRAVIRFMIELIDWQERENGDTNKSPDES